MWAHEHDIGDVDRFLELYLLSWSSSLFLDMFRNDIDAFDDEHFIFWKRAKDFCFNRCTFFNAIFIFLNTETVFPSDDTDDVSRVYFHSVDKLDYFWCFTDNGLKTFITSEFSEDWTENTSPLWFTFFIDDYTCIII